MGQRDVAAPGNLADHASRPKIERLADLKDSVANVAAMGRRLDLFSLDPTPEGYSPAMPDGVSFEFLVRPLGMNHIDANFHEIVQYFARCAFAKKEDELVVLVQSGAILAQQRLEERTPDIQESSGCGKAGQIVAKNDAIDLGSGQSAISFR